MNVGRGFESATRGRPVPELYTPQSKPYGLSFGEWTVRWWRWCLSQPRSSNPLSRKDRDDLNVVNYQPYQQTWFLTGTNGGFAEREAAIPRGWSILCPIINFIISTAENSTLQSDNDLITFAELDVDKIEKLSVNIDGVDFTDLKKYRVKSGSFDVTLPEDNIIGVTPGPTRAAADGYWLFIKPFDSGSHRIRFSGSCLSGTLNVGTKYSLSVQ